jgi:hypothetical protein
LNPKIKDVLSANPFEKAPTEFDFPGIDKERFRELCLDNFECPERREIRENHSCTVDRSWFLALDATQTMPSWHD